MNLPLFIIPEVRQFHLVNVGSRQELSLKFSPGINLITGQSGTGKSFVVHALLPAAAPRLSSRFGSTGGTITITYAQAKLEHSVFTHHQIGTDFSPERHRQIISAMLL